MKLGKASVIVAVVVAAGVIAGSTPATAIVDGQPATQLYPGLAATQIVFPGLGTALCGATLIGPDWALTAAHCVSDQQAAPAPIPMPGANVTIRVASNDRTAGGQVATGGQVILYPGWKWGTAFPVADFALVHLAQPLHAPVTPLAIRQVPVGTATRLVGWGLTSYPPAPGTVPPTILQQRDSTQLPASDCAGGGLGIGAGEICVGAGPCFGDSGSPALSRSPAQDRRRTDPGWVEDGLASRETSETDPCGQPVIYTDPNYPPFFTWIVNTILTGRSAPCSCTATATPSVSGTTSGTLTNRLKIKHFL